MCHHLAKETTRTKVINQCQLKETLSRHTSFMAKTDQKEKKKTCLRPKRHIRPPGNCLALAARSSSGSFCFLFSMCWHCCDCLASLSLTSSISISYDRTVARSSLKSKLGWNGSHPGLLFPRPGMVPLVQLTGCPMSWDITPCCFLLKPCTTQKTVEAAITFHFSVA